MKKLSLLFILFLLVSFQEKEAGMINPTEIVEPNLKDKEFLLEYFEETRNHLEEITEDLSEAQLNFKPAEERWSVNQVLEHIVLTEAAIFKMTEDMMAQEPAPERRSEIKVSDEALISGIEDRSKKVKASAELQPTGKFSNPDMALDKLEEQREAMLDFIRDTSEDEMRNHVTDSPFGPIDAYQSLLFIAGHTARHTKQIEEVLADSGFPMN